MNAEFLMRTTFPDDCLPPEAQYGSQEALLNAINNWALTRGYAFITTRSTTKASGKRVITYACDRRTTPPSQSRQRQRATTSRGTGCQFSVVAKESLDKLTWSLCHRSDQRFMKHNHEPSPHPLAHPTHRCLSTENLASISRLTKAGIAPREIETYLRQQDSALLATRQDIYNHIRNARQEQYGGESSIHALINQLTMEGFWNQIQFDKDQRITSVLFAHPVSIGYLSAYPDLLLLDCTYKTNKYNMPLLDIIGVDACQNRLLYSLCIYERRKRIRLPVGS